MHTSKGKNTIWDSLFSNLVGRERKGKKKCRTRNDPSPFLQKRYESKIQKGSHGDHNVSTGGSSSQCAENETLQAIGFLVSGSSQPSFVLVLPCTRPAASNRKGQEPRRVPKCFFLASAENSPRARGWEASWWPGWVSTRNKKVRRTNSRPAHAKTSPEKAFFPSNYARRSGNPPAFQPLTSPAAPGSAATTVLRHLRFHPFQPPARPGSRGPHDPGHLPRRLLPPRPPRPAPGRGHRYLPRGCSSRRRLIRFRLPLQMETVVPVAWDALLRLRPYSSSMPRAPQE